MHKFKTSVIAFAVLAVLVGFSMLAGALIVPSSPTAAAEKGPRQFYLTNTSHNGAQALTACATGYHMASVWEILDPSNLRYNRELGYTQADSGFGPPTGRGSTYGWIRTGAPAALSGDSDAGQSNCNAWTVGTFTGLGSFAYFNDNWNNGGAQLFTGGADCDSALKVWCIQD